jgi:transcriptional regulator with XRE-family HTH domain
MPTKGRRQSVVHSAAYQRFLKRLRVARAEAGPTQREAASALGRVASYVAKSENGERRVDVVELAQFAKLYRKQLRFFVE